MSKPKSATQDISYHHPEPVYEETGTFLDSIPMRLVNPLINLVCIAFIISEWAYCILNYEDLPDWIPIQYGFSGMVNYNGPKFCLFGLPAAAVFVFLSKNIRSFNPSKDKEYEKVLPERREQYVAMKNIVQKFSGLFTEFALGIAVVLMVKGPSLAIPQRKMIVQYLVVFAVIAFALGYLFNRSLLAQVNKPKTK